MTQLHFTSVSFTYPGLADPLIVDLSFAAAPGWTGVVGPNGAGKSTLLALAAGRIEPDSGAVAAPGSAVVCDQRTDHAPQALADLLSFPDADAGRLVSVLGLEADWPWRWETLSHGERKRAQIAAALWRRPELLVVDEPTNHLDREARRRLAEALERYDGVGLVVSHDRELLDRLCARCLFLEAPGRAVVRPGGVSAGLEEQERERLEKRRAWEAARAEHAHIESEAARRREEASGQNRKRSKHAMRWKDSDAREKVDRARISGADGQAGRLTNQLDGRRRQAAERLESLERPVRERVGISVHGERSRRDALIARDAGVVTLPDGRRVVFDDLVVRPDDRIALQGPNGAGKSTLVAALLDGGAGRAPGAHEVLWIPQEIGADEAAELVQEARGLDKASLGRVLSTVSRLASDPEKLLQTGLPSPGETRKLMLALGLERRPALVVMDEPTNHLDLVSMRCLETALADFVGALLVVSHDDRFVRAVARTVWTIRDGYLEVSEGPPT